MYDGCLGCQGGSVTHTCPRGMGPSPRNAPSSSLVIKVGGVPLVDVTVDGDLITGKAGGTCNGRLTIWHGGRVMYTSVEEYALWAGTTLSVPRTVNMEISTGERHMPKTYEYDLLTGGFKAQ